VPGISAIVALLSLDMTAALVASGRAVSSLALTVTGATNASPIVITTSSPHGILPGVSQAHHVVVAGVAGNTAANNLDADGVTNNAWIAVALDDTRFALYRLDPTGTLVPSSGNGAYTSGGTVSRAFTDGKALLGRQHIFELSYAPRVVFVPRGTGWGPKSVYSASRVAGYPSDEVRRQNQQRSIRTDEVQLEVHVWGVANPPDPNLDFDETQALYQQVVRSAHALMPGTYELGPGTWPDQDEGASQQVKAGHEFVFGLSMGTPVLDKLLPYAPADVASQLAVNLQPADGSPPEIAFQE